MAQFGGRSGVLSKVGLLLPATHAVNAFQGLAQTQVTTFNPLWPVLIFVGRQSFNNRPNCSISNNCLRCVTNNKGTGCLDLNTQPLDNSDFQSLNPFRF